MAWEEQIEIAGAAMQAGDLETAERSLKEALLAVSDDPVKRAITVFNLAITRDEQARPRAAEPLFKEAIELVADRLPAENENYGLFLQALIEFYVRHQRYADAEPLYERQVEHTRRMFGPRHPYVANLLSELGEADLKAGRPEPAERHLKEALGIMIEARGADHLQNVAIHTNLTNCYVKLGNTAEAEAHYRRALEIQAKAKQTVPGAPSKTGDRDLSEEET